MGTQNCYLAHRCKPKSGPIPNPKDPSKQPVCSLGLTQTHWLRAGELLTGLCLTATSQLGQLQHKTESQLLSKKLVPEPELCIQVRPTISSWYPSTSCTSSGSFTIRGITFYVPIVNFSNRFHIAPDIYGSSCGWWTHIRTDPCPLFRLSPTEPHGKKPRHQGLTYRPLHQVLLQGGVLVSLQEGEQKSLIFTIVEFFKPHFVWPLT